jgi:hypothetical protein
MGEAKGKLSTVADTPECDTFPVWGSGLRVAVRLTDTKKVKNRPVRVILLVVATLTGSTVIAACSSSNSAHVSSTAPTIGNINCQTSPSACPPYVTATTVPATYGCAGPHNFSNHQGVLRVVAYGHDAFGGNRQTELVTLSGSMAVQVGMCFTRFAEGPNRINVYFSTILPSADIGLVAQWLKAQSKLISHVVVLS